MMSCENETLLNSSLGLNSTCLNITYDCSEEYYAPSSSLLSVPVFHAMVYTMYCPMLIIAVLGNGAVCFIVSSTPRMRTVTNFFITNLALGDLLMAVFCVPFTFLPLYILQHWPFGGFMCTMVNYSQAVSVFVSAYTLVAISIDRYIAIMWPLRPRLTKRFATAIIFVVWLFALVTAMPIAMVSELQQPNEWYDKCQRYLCTERWPTEEQRVEYNITLMNLQFVLPLIVLIFTYTSIAIVVWCKRTPGEAENSRDQRFARSKRKMIKMMLAVVVVFTLCWLPFNTLLVISYSNMGPPDIPGLEYYWLGMHWLAMSHSCYNPIIYCYMNARFRAGFLQMLASIPGCEKCMPISSSSQRNSLGFGMAGSDSTENTLLHRVNTCNTYITMRHKMSTYQHPVRSASMMRYSARNTQRTHNNSDTIHEDQI